MAVYQDDCVFKSRPTPGKIFWRRSACPEGASVRPAKGTALVARAATAPPFFHHSIFRPNGPAVRRIVGPLGRRVIENGGMDYLSATTRLPGRCPSLGERLGLRPACLSAQERHRFIRRACCLDFDVHLVCLASLGRAAAGGNRPESHTTGQYFRSWPLFRHKAAEKADWSGRGPIARNASPVFSVCGKNFWHGDKPRHVRAEGPRFTKPRATPSLYCTSPLQEFRPVGTPDSSPAVHCWENGRDRNR